MTPKKPSKPKDRRVLRTRRTLREALVQLILQRGWEKVSVLDVCERADVGRSTFYTHFADKEELLLSGFDDLRQALRARHPLGKGPESGKPLAFAGSMIEHARDNLRLFRALVGKRSGHVVQQRFKQVVLALVIEDLESEAGFGAELLPTAHFLAGAFVELLGFWLDTRTGMQAVELETLFLRLAEPILARGSG